MYREAVESKGSKERKDPGSQGHSWATQGLGLDQQPRDLVSQPNSPDINCQTTSTPAPPTHTPFAVLSDVGACPLLDGLSEVTCQNPAAVICSREGEGMGQEGIQDSNRNIGVRCGGTHL